MTTHTYRTNVKANPYRVTAICQCGWQSQPHYAGNSPLHAHRAAHQAAKQHAHEMETK